MARLFEAWEDSVDADVLNEVRDACRTLESRLRRLGEGASDEDVVPLLEEFVQTINALEAEHAFITPDEARDITEWYEDLATRYDLSIGSLEDLDEVQPAW